MALAPTPYASEGGKWYTRDGEPVGPIPKADGKGTRDATVTDARKNQYVRSVTSHLKALANAGIDRWKISECIEICLLSDAMDRWKAGEIDDDTVRATLKKEFAEGKGEITADRGKLIHWGIQCYFLGQPYPPELLEQIPNIEDYVATALVSIEKLTGLDVMNLPDGIVMAPEVTFGDWDRYEGGTADLVIYQVDGNGEVLRVLWVLDFKTRSFNEDDVKPGPRGGMKFKPYDTEPLQVSAYGNHFNAERVGNVWLSRDYAKAHYQLEYDDDVRQDAFEQYEHVRRFNTRKDKVNLIAEAV
jgi:hypothetical protein